MKVYGAPEAATTAVANTPDRPGAALLHDHPDGRLMVFRIDPGQQVPVHTSVASVFLTVISGTGYVSGVEGERAVAAGDVIAFEPSEPHGMRAASERLVLTALITPRPGTLSER